MVQVQITSNGIKRALKSYSELDAIVEYIRNGFDANATEIHINYIKSELGLIDNISIQDNGDGINKKELDNKFKPFLESEKEYFPDAKIDTFTTYGKKGIGRLTFFRLAAKACWTTTYRKDGKRMKYDICIERNNIHKYDPTVEVETKEKTGTTVEFTGIEATIVEDELIEHLQKEFAWFLELNKSKQFRIFLNDVELKYSDTIITTKDTKFENNGYKFEINLVQWKTQPYGYSRYFFTNNSNKVQYSRHTTLNKKGDDYYHSVFIKSSFFNEFNKPRGKEDENQLIITGKSIADQEYKELIKFVDKFLRELRKPFLETHINELIERYEADKLMPEFNLNSDFDKARKGQLEELIKDLYVVEPRLFTNLKKENKKTFIYLLNLVLDNNQVEQLFEIIKAVVELTPMEIVELSEILKIASLSNIITTQKLIIDRAKAIEMIKNLVFKQDLNANERDDIQKAIEKHYWIFGEQFTLVTAAEPKFEEALRRFTYLLTGENKKKKIDHEDKNKEMDIFMIRQDLSYGRIKSVVIELKHPKIKLGDKEYQQIFKYSGVIIKQPECNDPKMSWDFMLVGNTFDTSGTIERLIDNAKGHGEVSLASCEQNGRIKIYVKTWSQIFNEFELRHKFLLEKIDIKRKELVTGRESKNDIKKELNRSSAKQNKQVYIPKNM